MVSHYLLGFSTVVVSAGEAGWPACMSAWCLMAGGGVRTTHAGGGALGRARQAKSPPLLQPYRSRDPFVDRTPSWTASTYHTFLKKSCAVRVCSSKMSQNTRMNPPQDFLEDFFEDFPRGEHRSGRPNSNIWPTRGTERTSPSFTPASIRSLGMMGGQKNN